MPTLTIKSTVLVSVYRNSRKSYTVFMTVKFWQPQLYVTYLYVDCAQKEVHPYKQYKCLQHLQIFIPDLSLHNNISMSTLYFVLYRLCRRELISSELYLEQPLRDT